MKIREITVKNLTDFMRLDEPTELEKEEVERMRSMAIAYMSDYTGLTVEQLDEHESLNQALFILVADMFDNRNLYLDTKSANINKSVEIVSGIIIKTDEGFKKVKNFISKTPLKLVGQLSKLTGKAAKGFFGGLCTAFKTFSKK